MSVSDPSLPEKINIKLLNCFPLYLWTYKGGLPLVMILQEFLCF